MWIYDSRNYWGLTDMKPITDAKEIYDSRNYWGLTDIVTMLEGLISTIVEITEVLQTRRCVASPGLIYDSRNYWGLTDTPEIREALASTIVEITEVLQTISALHSCIYLR